MRNLTPLITAISLLVATSAIASPYGSKICNQDPRFKCMKVGGSGWSDIRNNRELYEIVKRINRVNIGLSGTIAVPRNTKNITLMDVAPFPNRMPGTMENILMIDIDKMAWGAYDLHGNLQKWGPIAPGKSWCADVRSSCHTVTGKFAIYRKVGAGCKSGKFPIPTGGASMPWCSFFHGGYAIHAGKLPGQPDSHGCVRSYYEDAKWLSQNFLKIGTLVHVKPYDGI